MSFSQLPSIVAGGVAGFIVFCCLWAFVKKLWQFKKWLATPSKQTPISFDNGMAEEITRLGKNRLKRKSDGAYVVRKGNFVERKKSNNATQDSEDL